MEEIIKRVAGALHLDLEELLPSLKKEGTNDWLPEAEIGDKLATILTDSVSTAKKDQYKRGVRETALKVHKLATDLGITLDKTAELPAQIEAIKQGIEDQKAAGNGGDPATLEPEKLAALPAVKSLIAERLREATAERERLQSEFDTYKKSQELSSVRAKAEAHIAEKLSEAGAVLESEGVPKSERLKRLYRLLDWQNIREKDGKFVIVDPETGEPATDPATGRPVDFDKLYMGEAKVLFTFSKVPPGKGPNPPKGSGQGDKISFADAKEYNDYIARETDPVKIAAAHDAYAEFLENA